MRNINELIGIIKGINFDGVINDREVLRLQAWADTNRNLAYDHDQIELIRLVDSVLEDHIIDDDERDILLSKSEEFLKETGDDSGSIYELNGIIEGIVCDGEVNDAEVRHLNEWMDKHGKIVRKNKASKKLCMLVEDILEDGIVTEEEQQCLLDMLSERIRISQFESKLDYLCRLVKEKKNIGVDLIDILDNESAMQKIHSRAEEQLLYALKIGSTFIINNEIIVISLVLIAMLEYDGNYYENVRAIYSEAYRYYSEQKVEGTIRSILSRYKKNSDSGSRTRIINVALENAIVPKAFLAAFFEFIFDIYKLNFDYDLPKEPYDEFMFVYEGLRNNMLSDGDDISLNVTQKTYKLTAATKQLIRQETGLDALIKLSILIVTIIDKRFWNKEVRVFNPYLKEGYEKWERLLKGTDKKERSTKHEMSELRSKWEPRFEFINNVVYLIPPIHKVKAQYDYRDISVVVLNGDEELYRDNDCFIKEIIGGYQVSPDKIMIKKPLSKMVYKLIAGDEIIYDSKKTLFREFIVFDEFGKEIKNNTDYEGPAYFCFNGIADLMVKSREDFFNIGYKLVRVGDCIGIGNDVFNFSSMVKPGIFGQLHKNCFICDKSVRLSVYKTVDTLLFEADNASDKFEVVINGKGYKLNDYELKKTYKDSTTKYVVKLNNLDESGIYTVEVNQFVSGKKKHILQERLAYDPGLEYCANPIDDTSMLISVSSGLMKEKVALDIPISQFSDDCISFSYEGSDYYYLLPFNLGIYKLDEKNFKTVDSELWIEDISLDSELTIYDSECDGVLVYADNGSLLEDNIEVKDFGAYKTIRIGFINSYKTENTYVLVVLTSEGRKKYSLACYNKCVMDTDKTDVIFSDYPRQLRVTPFYHGGNGVFYEVKNAEGEKIYQSGILRSGQTDVIEKIKSFEDYTISFHEKTKVLMLRKNTQLYEMNKFFFAKSDFSRRTFKIVDAYFNHFDKYRGEFVEKVYHFSKAYLYIEGTRVDGKLKGRIFVKTMRGEWFLDGINPVEVELCSDIIDNTIDVYITNNGDGLLLDFEKHGILNSLENPTAPDIFLYTIDVKGDYQI
ncbi:hypothetical protein [Butyrivibrio sp. NC2002]|uniref:hypothetical protein n=1 Tax=Butyrivibrio sp. NC2002 TaxID=1410610 RepID=UPI000569209B|nr:hypothetical protein [Butyrivibrio sp. NC2002]